MASHGGATLTGWGTESASREATKQRREDQTPPGTLADDGPWQKKTE